MDGRGVELIQNFEKMYRLGTRFKGACLHGTGWLTFLQQVLYLKNLGPRVTMKDLVSLFARFQKEDSLPIQFRLLSGRMRGQAFITFPGESLSCASQFFHDP